MDDANRTNDDSQGPTWEQADANVEAAVRVAAAACRDTIESLQAELDRLSQMFGDMKTMDSYLTNWEKRKEAEAEVERLRKAGSNAIECCEHTDPDSDYFLVPKDTIHRLRDFVGRAT